MRSHLTLALLVIMLSGCNGYPRFNPSSCSMLEINGEPSPLWECQ